MQLDAAEPDIGPARAGFDGDGEPERAGAAAQVDDRPAGRPAPGSPARPQGDVDQELAAPAGDEHAWVDQDPQAGELGPADHLLKRLARGPPR